ncbi:MAG: B12-binding domain-containing radical SAM protein, partial [bacterium]
MSILLISLQIDSDVIGLKTLHAHFLKNNFNSTLLHLPYFTRKNYNRYLEHINEFVSKISPDFIGISLMSIEYFMARDLTEHLKRSLKSIPIIWGGIHPTISPEKCLDHADYVCRGEGEQTMIDVMSAAGQKEDIRKINNLCYYENGRIKKNPLYPLIENLDEVSHYTGA